MSEGGGIMDLWTCVVNTLKIRLSSVSDVMKTMILSHAFGNATTEFIMQSPPPPPEIKTPKTSPRHNPMTGDSLSGSLPAVVPAAMVAATGDWRLLTLDINLNRIPSRAMAKRMRGRGNMEPNRLGRRGFTVKLRAFWERKHDTCTTVKEQQGEYGGTKLLRS